MLLPLPAGSPLFIPDYSHLENKYKWAREIQVLSLENEELFGEMVRISNSDLRMIPQRVLAVRLAWAGQCKLDSAAKGSQTLCLKSSNGFSLHLEWNPKWQNPAWFCPISFSNHLYTWLCSNHTGLHSVPEDTELVFPTKPLYLLFPLPKTVSPTAGVCFFLIMSQFESQGSPCLLFRQKPAYPVHCYRSGSSPRAV